MADDPTPETGAPEQPGGEGEAEPTKGGGPDQTQALLRKLRKAEKELESFRKSESERKDADLGEVEKLRKKLLEIESENSTLKTSIRESKVQRAFDSEALKAGVIDVDAAYRLADLSGVELDDDGKLIGVKEALKSLKDSRSYLFGSPKVPPGGVGAGGGNPSSGNPAKAQVLTQQTLRSMSKEDFEKLHSEIVGGRIKL